MARYRIGKTFKFDAAHRLDGLPDGHKCGNLHGHTYEVTLHLEADDVDAVGFVVDYGDLAPVKRWVDGSLDHAYLNDVLGFNPTAERLAEHVYSRWKSAYPALAAVTVKETGSTYAEYRPGPRVIGHVPFEVP